MAKLSARNRKEVVRLDRARDVSHDELVLWPLVLWRRSTVALMSDGTVLEKKDVRFRPSQFETGPRAHSYGWKVVGKAKAELTAEQFAAVPPRRNVLQYASRVEPRRSGRARAGDVVLHDQARRHGRRLFRELHPGATGVGGSVRRGARPGKRCSLLRRERRGAVVKSVDDALFVARKYGLTLAEATALVAREDRDAIERALEVFRASHGWPAPDAPLSRGFLLGLMKGRQ
jgi:hypothetical protein